MENLEHVVKKQQEEINNLRDELFQLKRNLSTFVSNYNLVNNIGRVRGQYGHPAEKRKSS